MHRFSVRRGIAVTAVGDKYFVDPQVEPDYRTSEGPSHPDELQLALSRAMGPRSIVDRASLHPGMLTHQHWLESRRYRLHTPVEQPVGRVALVSVVDHDPTYLFGMACTLYKDEQSYRLHHHAITHRNPNLTSPVVDASIDLVLLTPGTSLNVRHETGSHFSDVETIRLVYDPDAPNGLVPYKPGAPPNPPDTPPDVSGDREPRNPLPVPLAGAAYVE